MAPRWNDYDVPDEAFGGWRIVAGAALLAAVLVAVAFLLGAVTV